MKCTIPEISWHNREPVLSSHIQPFSEKFYRLATGGADCHVLIWQLTINESGAVKIEALSDLTRHQRAVNSVRWSPNGQYLATADDDANIIIWQLKTDNIPLLEGENNENKETWIVHKIMRGHKEDIYDLCWSPTSLKLLSGSIDNTAILWDFTKGKNEHILNDHKGFVQGVAWDPRGHYLATISTDRICRLFESSGKQVKFRIQRGTLPIPSDHYLHNKDVKFFHDDTFKSFFRRLDFSPDGTLLAVPSGRFETEDCKKIMNGTLIFAVDSFNLPVAVLPSGKQCSTVVRFCPLLFEIQEDGPDPIISLPFRMIIAVGTDHDVILYDTQQTQPFAYFKDIHYTRLTDLTWSDDGLILVASSTDGYCALITFEPDELGVQYVKEESEVEESVLNVSGCVELEKDENVETVKPKKLSLLEQWAVKTPKKKNEISSLNNDEETSKRKHENEPNKERAVKRIKPIPVEDKKINDNVPINKVQNSPKVSPLINFLKKTTKKESDECRKSATPEVTIDLTETEEARDGWNCEKGEVQGSKCEFPDDEYTEEFSLHLEETNSQAENNHNHSESETKSTEKSDVDGQTENIETDVKCDEQKINRDCEIKAHVTENIQKEIPPVCSELLDSKDKNIECVQSKDSQLAVKQTDVPLKNPPELGNVNKLEDKSSVPKRRIPLITLSSPKHKKK